MAAILKQFRASLIIALVAIAVTGGTVIAQNNNAPATASGGYKIGVVDMNKLIAESPKRQQAYANLEAEVNRLQQDIDKLQTNLEAQKKALESGAASMSEQERMDARSKLEQDTLAFRYELDKRQRLVDGKEETVLKEVVGDIEKAIQQVATSESYHLILNAGGARSTVLFSTPTIDITPRVQQIVGAAPPAAATPAASGNKDQGSKKR